MWVSSQGCFTGVSGIWKVIPFILFLVVLVPLLVRGKTVEEENQDRVDSLEILKRRLASGEITLEEFNELKKVL